MFSVNLKTARKRKDYSLEQLANEYNRRLGGGMSRGTLSKYENGKQEPLLNTAYKLSQILGVSLDSLANLDTSKTA